MPQTDAYAASLARIDRTNKSDQNTRRRCLPDLECQARHRGQRASYLGSFCLYGYFRRSPPDSEGSRGLLTFTISVTTAFTIQRYILHRCKGIHHCVTNIMLRNHYCRFRTQTVNIRPGKVFFPGSDQINR